MKLRKLFLPFFVILLSALLVTGCSKSDSGKEDTAQTEEPAKKKRKPRKKEVKKDDTSEVTTTENQEEDIKTSEPQTEAAANGEPLFENDQICLAVSNVNFNDILGPTIQLHIENRTNDSHTYILNDSSVNGYMINGSMYEEVPAQSSKEGTINFSSQHFEEAGITAMDEVTLSIRGNISGNWDDDGLLVNEEFTFYPTGKSPEDLKSLPREPQSGDEVVLDENGLKVVVIGLKPDHFMGQELKFYIENNSDRNLSFIRSDFVANGKAIDGIGAESVAAGKKLYSSVYFFTDNLESNGIKEIKKLKFNVKIIDANDWFADPILSKTCEYTVK